jgi:hypothetical protein
MAKRRPLPPRRLRMNRKQRLQSAQTFIKNYGGRNIARGYSHWYGVDRRCAVLELKMLGVHLKEDYVAAVFVTARDQEERAIRARLNQPAGLEAEDVDSVDSFTSFDGDPSES